MKRIVTFIVSFLYAGIVAQAQAQAVDTAFFQCLYKMDYINDTENPKGQIDIAMLLVGEQYTLFGSRINYIADSLRRVETKEVDILKAISEGKTQMNVPTPPFRTSDNTESYIIHRATGAVQCFGNIWLRSGHTYSEERSLPEWTIHSDTKNFLEHSCQKATAHYGGRDWTVWFALDIPISEGPWLLRGLPGLILMAQDAEQQYVFECMRLGADIVQIIGMNDRIKYKNISKMEFFEDRRVASEDYLASLKKRGVIIDTSGTGFSISPEAQKRMGITKKFNPIERIAY